MLNHAILPEGLEAERCFGPNLEATVVFYKQTQHLSYERIVETMRDLHGVNLSDRLGLHSFCGCCFIEVKACQRKEEHMPSVALEEIFQRIPLLTPEEKEQLIGLLRFDRGRANEGSDATVGRIGKNGTEASPVRLVPVRSFDEERKWISQHRERYRGQFVALAGSQLLAHGDDEGEVIDQARRAGVQSPFVTYIETEAEERHLSGLLIS